jgi:hypothetical protein
MFAINHAATALLLHRRDPSVPFVPVLLSVQAVEFAWVVLHYLGVERTTTASVVRDLGDIHLVYMPFSHSVLTVVAAAILAWGAGAVAGRPRVGFLVAVGIVSHIVLDLATHNGDIPLWPSPEAPKYGTFLYERMPAVAFLLELGYGILCWRVFRGRRALLAIIVAFNLANISLFFAAIPGPEEWLAGRPLVLVTLIFAQIIITLWAVWWGARLGGVSPQRNVASA